MKRYTAATVIIHHFSRLSFTHLQSTLSSKDTLQVKKAFERYCESNGVKVLHYHADNGRFVDHAFIEDIKWQNQKVTYCGINVHFQNGVAEKSIRDLQDLTPTAMHHASACWPRAFLNHLWPYTLRWFKKALGQQALAWSIAVGVRSCRSEEHTSELQSRP